MPRFAQDKSHFTHFVPGELLHGIPFHSIKGPSLNAILYGLPLNNHFNFFAPPNHCPPYETVNCHTLSGCKFTTLFFWLHLMASGILALQSGIEPAPPVLEARILNHWTMGAVPHHIFSSNQSVGFLST